MVGVQLVQLGNDQGPSAGVACGQRKVQRAVASDGPEVAVEGVVGQQHLQNSATGVVHDIRQRIRGLVRADVSCFVVRVLIVAHTNIQCKNKKTMQ